MFTNKFGKPHCLRVQELIYYLLEKKTTSVDFKNLNVNGKRHVRERKNKNTDCEERFSIISIILCKTINEKKILKKLNH